jgi:hypothetical protein
VAALSQASVTHTLISTIWLFAGITIDVTAEVCVIAADWAITT